MSKASIELSLILADGDGISPNLLKDQIIMDNITCTQNSQKQSDEKTQTQQHKRSHSEESFNQSNADSIKPMGMKYSWTKSLNIDQAKSARHKEQVIEKKLTYKTDQIFQSIRNEDQMPLSDSGKRIIKKDYRLADILKQQKIQQICKNFIQKLKMNNSKSEPIEFQFKKRSKKSFLQKKPLKIHPNVSKIIRLMDTIAIFLLLFVDSLYLAYDNVQFPTFLAAISGLVIFLQVLNIFQVLLTKNDQAQTRHQTFQQTFCYYLKSNEAINLLCILVIIFSFFLKETDACFTRMIVLIKIPHWLQNIQKLQITLFRNLYQQQYWSLAKLFLFNIILAHILSIFLASMIHINPNQNWMTTKMISHCSWFQQYVWSYYWGTTIMLTIGFGDMVPTNYQEALCVTAIQMVSCMILAYNINGIGTLIKTIRSQDLEVNRKKKLLSKIANGNKISEETEAKVLSFIQESAIIEKKFNIQDETEFMESLPQSYKNQLLCQANRTIFKSLPFFTNLFDMTLMGLAEKIEMKICHPAEKIKLMDPEFNIFILKSGELGLKCKKQKCDLNLTKSTIDFIKIQDKNTSKLIGLQFITKLKPIYDIFSLDYSILYVLKFQTFIQCLRKTKIDFQFYSLLRDKCKTIINEFQIVVCQNCNTKHTKFTCPRLHYQPFSNQIIIKSLSKISKNKRDKTFIRYKQKFTALKLFDSDQNNSSKTISLVGAAFVERNVKKNWKYFITQMQKVEEVEDQQIDLIRENVSIQNIFKNEGKATILLQKYLPKKMAKETNMDEVWLLQTDKMYNYKGYFSEDNPCNLMDKYPVENRINPIHFMKKRELKELDEAKRMAVENIYRINTCKSEYTCKSDWQ